MLGLTLLRAAPARAGEPLTLAAAVTRSGRIVVARFTGVTHREVGPDPFTILEITVEKTLKGPAYPRGKKLRVVDPSEWIKHARPEESRDGIVWAYPRCAIDVQPEELERGSRLVFFLSREPLPRAFDPSAVLGACRLPYAPAEVENDIAAL